MIGTTNYPPQSVGRLGYLLIISAVRLAYTMARHKFKSRVLSLASESIRGVVVY
jgi:hypothetical protein